MGDRMDDAGFFLGCPASSHGPLFFVVAASAFAWLPSSSFSSSPIDFPFPSARSWIVQIILPPSAWRGAPRCGFSPQTAPGLIGWAFSFSFVFVGGFLFG